MLFKLNKFAYFFISIVFLFCDSKIEAHNDNNGGCKNHCLIKLKIKKDQDKIKQLKENDKYHNDFNSCLKKSLCRG